MATFVRHTACSVCGSSDALAHYSDGSSYCFSHGKSLHHSDRPGFVVEEEEEERLVLPKDLSHDFPEAVVSWLRPTGVTIEELIQNDYYFSAQTRLLWRLLGDGKAESRRVGSYGHGPKTRFYGSKSNRVGLVVGQRRQGGERGPFQQVCGTGAQLAWDNGKENYSPEGANHGVQLEEGQKASLRGNLTRELVVVEDSISAIKCARYCDSIPLFGSSCANDRLSAIVKEYSNIYVWLDSDKYSAAISIANRIQMLGKKSSVILTKLDPKYLNASEYVQIE